MPAIEDLMDEWLRRVRRSEAIHRDAARYYNGINNRLGVGLVGLSTLIGAFVLATLESEVSYWVRVVLVLISLAAALMAVLQTLLRFPERAERHRVAGLAFGEIRRSIEGTRVKMRKGHALEDSQLESFRTAMDQASRQAPGVSARLRQSKREPEQGRREAA